MVVSAMALVGTVVSMVAVVKNVAIQVQWHLQGDLPAPYDAGRAQLQKMSLVFGPGEDSPLTVASGADALPYNGGSTGVGALMNRVARSGGV